MTTKRTKFGLAVTFTFDLLTSNLLIDLCRQVHRRSEFGEIPTNRKQVIIFKEQSRTHTPVCRKAGKWQFLSADEKWKLGLVFAGINPSTGVYLRPTDAFLNKWLLTIYGLLVTLTLWPQNAISSSLSTTAPTEVINLVKFPRAVCKSKG